MNLCNLWLSLPCDLARDVDQHLGPGFDLQFLAAIHGQRAGAARAADDQTNSRAFTTTGNTADDRADRRADTRALHSLLGSAAGFHAAFVIRASRILAIHARHVDRKSTRLN